MKLINLTPAMPILPNSSPEILRPMPGCGGVFQVVWIAEIDSHALLYQRDGQDSAITIAAHHNGHCCHALAERMANGEGARISDQVEYIRRCGGITMSADHVVEIAQGKP